MKKVHCLEHRGPDEHGIYRDTLCALGHRRLSIIDLNTGRQPIANEDRTVWVVCNGEIYNYREIAEDLKSRGHRFSTESDSEVIVHLYEEYQEECAKHLNGIFAFAIWDGRKRRLLLARDHLGVKPLFYYRDNKRFLFGSELKAILQDPHVERKVDSEGLFHYLSLNYLPSPLTMIAGVHALPAAHWLALDDRGVRIERYWDVSFRRHSRRTVDELTGQLREQIDATVEMQLVSDVEVGAFLSGGLDSSSIVQAMHLRRGRGIKTFNVGFAEASYDESSYAQLVAREFDTQHYEVRCEPADYLRYLPKIIWHADNLTCDISMLPLFLVSKLAREHVKVVLSGDGADELFAGYPTYLADGFVSAYQQLPKVLSTGLLPSLVERMPVSTRKMSWDLVARRFVRGATLSPAQAHFSWRSIFSDDDKRRLLDGGLLDQIATTSFWSYERHYEAADGKDALSRNQYADMKVWLVDSILAKVDTMSMANSLEVRVPFLNPRFVEFACQLPSNLKLRGLTRKYLLKRAMRGRLPRRILGRAKAGFQIPIDAWLRTSLRELLSDVLCEDAVRRIGLFDAGYVQRLVHDHLAKRRNHGYQLLGLLHFCLWHERFVAERPEPS